MNPIHFATKYVYFDKSSPISGAFDIAKYPFLKKPLLAVDNIRIKRLTIYKASSCLGSVFREIAMAFLIEQQLGDMIFVAQTDDDASKWVKTRGKSFFMRIDPIAKSLSSERHNLTNDLWQFVMRNLIITGPGPNAAQSDQVRFLATDESHLDSYVPGRLAEFEERLSKRWDRLAIHVTTAANEGKEVDRFYYLGGQNEWHHRCPKCTKLFWMLWEDESKQVYNGERVFIYNDSDEIFAVCPHCQADFKDLPRQRFELCKDGDYEAKNQNPAHENESFRWNVFAAHWITWRDTLQKFREAINAAKMGDLKPHEDFKKKRLCVSYRPEIPDLGDQSPWQDYKSGDIWVTKEPKKRFCSFDVQDAGGLHFWAQSDEYTETGESRRLAYSRLSTWQACREFQLYHQVENSDTACDYGHRDREVFAKCAEFKWYSLKSGDEAEYSHCITNDKGKIIVSRPYSQTQLHDSMIGKPGKKMITKAGSIPKGFCLGRLWSKFEIGSILMRLKSGASGVYYGIPADINPDFIAQINSYVFAEQQNRKDGTVQIFLKQVKKDDHAFATSSQIIILAMVAGFFPIGKLPTISS